ncbi:MAG: SUMF1/EgtB/PvdO family nonheme iron enzyme [Gammaproteobacteria bacterium]
MHSPLRVALSAATALLLAACTTAVNNGDKTTGEFRDCDSCPVMIEIPAGSFLMGTAEADRLIDPRTGKPAINDGPQHEVIIGAAFAMGKYEVSVDEFATFVAATGHETVEKCMEFSPERSFTMSAEHSWRVTGFDQSGTEPVVCLSFFDAQAYTEWLSKTAGQPYRLPSEAEWEYATRAGSTTSYFWGNDTARSCDYTNVRSPGAFAISDRQADSDINEGFPCDDGFSHTSPAGSFLPNAFGLYDTQGNAWEWVTDCNHKNYEGAPIDGSPWLDEGTCQFGVIRGGSYINLVERSNVTVRAGRPRSGSATNMGFRVVRGSTASASITGGEGVWLGSTAKADSLGAELFDNNCAACHVERNIFKGIYGKDQESVATTIRSGGNNVMSMPAFSDRLSEEEIEELAAYVRQINGWD